MIRRTLDILLSLVGLIVLAVPLLFIGILVRITSPGPAIFKQTRIGRHGVPFELYKFRSMQVVEGGPQVTAAGDQRVTSIGKIIRAGKMDELPQLLNVLKGNMSLVGPRPEVPKYVEMWPSREKELILSVRPGITDPVTLSLKNESEILGAYDDPESYYISVLLPEKVKKYVHYVNTRTLWGDVVVIFNTLKAILYSK